MNRGTLMVAAGIALGAVGMTAARHDDKHEPANEFHFGCTLTDDCAPLKETRGRIALQGRIGLAWSHYSSVPSSCHAMWRE